MKITINNYDELLEFVKREDISVKDATEIVCKTLKVISLFEMTRKELIIATDYFIKTYCQKDSVSRSLFLNQISLEFDIREIFKAYSDNETDV
jgi:hypothetical protein